MSEGYHKLDDQPQKPKVMDILTGEYIFPKDDVETPQIDQNKKYKKPAFTAYDMNSTFIDMKKSFEYVGDNSTFQKRITTILVIQWISFSFMVNSMAYFFRSPTFHCKLPLTDIFIACPQSIACKLIGTQHIKTSYSSGGFLNFDQVSIVQEFNLICQHQDWAPLAQSLFFFGGFISGYLFSYLSQQIGRRSILLIVLVLSISSMIFCALAPSIQVFCLGYFLIGFSLFGYQTNVYIYIGEISAIRFRTISINMLTMVFVGTPIFLPFLGFLPTWRYAFLFFALVLICTVPFAYKCFLESPRFLLTKKCYKQARQIFRQISLQNKRPPYGFKLIEQIEQQNHTFIQYERKSFYAEPVYRIIPNILHQTYNYFTLFKYNSLKKPTLILMYLWMFRFFMYYGLNLALQSLLKSGLMLTITISFGALMQILGTFGVSIMTTLFFKKFKLDIIKIALLVITLCTLLMWFIQIEISCKLIPIFDGDQLCVTIVLMIVVVMFVKFFNTVFFAGLIVYYSQVYPTPVRSLGCGFTLTFGRLGTIIVPFYINYMKVQYPTKNSLCFLTPFGIIAYCLCYLMPYTQIQGMKQKIKEQDNPNIFQLQTIFKN